MEALIDKGLVIAYSMIFLLHSSVPAETIVLLLIEIVLVSLGSYLEQKKCSIILYIGVLLAGIYYPPLWILLGVLIYDLTYHCNYWTLFLGIIPFFIVKGNLNGVILFAWIVFPVVSFLLASKTRRLKQYQHRLIQQRDQSVELELALKEKNNRLIQKQDDEIHMATLLERNRIAREIHDNVGHMLSRSLLMLGALLATVKEPALKENLQQIKESLNMAMNSIRESVHDLHDTSLNMEMALKGCLKECKDSFETNLVVDVVGENMERTLKYMFLAIVKEGISNCIRHSKGTKLSVILREHPGFYQLTIEDNGKVKGMNYQEGMGLTNIRDRVERVNGSVRITLEQGFRIFITVQKDGVKDESSSNR